MRLFLYNEDGKIVKEFILKAGEQYLGTRSGDASLCLLSTPDEGKALLRIEVSLQNEVIVAELAAEGKLFVNDKHAASAMLQRGDEIFYGGHLIVFEEPKKLKRYLVSQGDRKGEILFSDSVSGMTIESVLPSEEIKKATAGISPSRDTYKLEKSHRQMASLLQISQEINAVFNLPALAEKIIDYLFQLMLIDRALILIKEAGGEPRTLRVAYKRGCKSSEVRVSKTIVNTVLRDGVAVSTSNALEDPRFESKDSVLEEQIHSAMCVPLLRGDALLGIVYVDSTNPAVAFELEDLQFLSVLANLTAIAVENARRFHKLELEVGGWRASCKPDDFVIGESERGQKVYELIQRVACSNITVLLYGESGTGKELAAHLIHQLSPRKDKPFVTVNCATLAESLIESELFGYEKGAFTGAGQTKPGRFEVANAGTVFLDEIGEISINVQSKLLRVIEGLGFERVGGVQTIHPDVRIIVATNKNLEEEIERGRFRADLYFRLKVFPIRLPPLRERREDTTILAEYFLRKFAIETVKSISGFTREAKEWLLEYDWPGNIRELKNVIERAVLLCDEPLITRPLLFSPTEPTPQTTWKSHTAEGFFARQEDEEQAIREALRSAGGNKSKAAKILGIARHQLMYRMHKYNIDGGES
jgi:transcriptional regulator with GAF, ATPase, and Fis domain